MPTEFDTKFRALGKKLVGKFGVTTGTYRSASRTPINPMDIISGGGEVTNTSNDQAITMSPPLRYKKMDIDGSTIQSHDMYVIISGEDWDVAYPSATPQANDSLIINSENFIVINPDLIYSGEQVAAYKIQVRRGK